MPRGARS